MLDIDISFEKVELPDLSEGQISKLTRSVAARVRKAVIANTPVGNRPLSGRKRVKYSWTPVRKDEGGYSFGNPAIAARFLEFGSELGERPWPTPRSRTVYNEGRVYSSQAPEGITTKAKADEIANAAASELFNLLVKGKSLATR